MNRIFLKRSEDLLLEATLRSQEEGYDIEIVRRLLIESAMLAIDGNSAQIAHERMLLLRKLHKIRPPRLHNIGSDDIDARTHTSFPDTSADFYIMEANPTDNLDSSAKKSHFLSKQRRMFAETQSAILAAGSHQISPASIFYDISKTLS